MKDGNSVDFARTSAYKCYSQASYCPKPMISRTAKDEQSQAAINQRSEIKRSQHISGTRLITRSQPSTNDAADRKKRTGAEAPVLLELESQRSMLEQKFL